MPEYDGERDPDSVALGVSGCVGVAVGGGVTVTERDGVAVGGGNSQMK